MLETMSEILNRHHAIDYGSLLRVCVDRSVSCSAVCLAQLMAAGPYSRRASTTLGESGESIPIQASPDAVGVPIRHSNLEAPTTDYDQWKRA